MTTTSPPVLLIHGYGTPRASMWPMRSRLQRRGFEARTVRLTTLNLGDIKSSASMVATQVEAMVAQNHGAPVDVVGASLGGLIGLYYAWCMGGFPHFRRFIALGTPFHGTWASMAAVASMGPVSKAAWQVKPGSQFLAELHEARLAHNGEGPDLVSMYASLDPIVPPSCAHLDGAKNVEIGPEIIGIRAVAHQHLVLSKPVVEMVAAALAGAE